PPQSGAADQEDRRIAHGRPEGSSARAIAASGCSVGLGSLDRRQREALFRALRATARIDADLRERQQRTDHAAKHRTSVSCGFANAVEWWRTFQMADGVGFEPTRELPLCRFSRPVP